nr:cytochrome P450 9e2-like [Megalopta genalis]
MDAVSVLVALAAVAVVVYYYAYRGLNYFKKHGIDHIKPTPFLGNMGQFVFRKKPMADVLKRTYYHNPDAKYVGFYEFSVPIIVLRDVELIKNVAIKNVDSFAEHRDFIPAELNPLFEKMLFVLGGNEWKDVRAQLTPIFTSSKIKAMFMLMTQVASRFADYLTKLPEEERSELEFKNVMTKYTNDVIASCVFGLDVDTFKDPDNALYANGKKATSFNGFLPGIKFMIQRNMTSISKLLNIKLIGKDVEDFFGNTIKENMKYREENGIYRPDMLQHLLDIQKNNKTEKPFSDRSVISNAFSFYFGGYDSVSSQASMVMYNLLANPECLKRLQEEVDEVLENTKGQITYEAISGMEYMDAVVNEALRLYPAVIFLDRQCSKDFELPPAVPGGKPFTVKKGTNLWIPVHAIQTDPKYYDNPDQFDPDRFLQDGKRILGSGTYMPFGIGPRICIGIRFATIEMKVMIFYILARCDLKNCSKTEIPLKLSVNVLGNVARDGYWMNIQPRENCNRYVDNLIPNGTCNAGCQ